MTSNKNEQVMNLQVTAELAVNVIPNENYEYLMTTKEVAEGYGVTPQNIREHQRCNDDFIEGKHFIKGISISDTLGKNAQPHQVFWTKRGIVRLGFFIKSERAKLFRDWAEELIIKVDEQRDLFGEVVIPKALPKRKHNRLTPTRMVEILADVAKIEDRNLRLSLIEKLGV